jgi:hypothetical protein
VTGPEHYREAERLLTVGAGDRGSILNTICTTAAQVHATLALAAATANRTGGAEFNDYGTWSEGPA